MLASERNNGHVSVKKCFVPCCGNTSDNTNKIFVRLPLDRDKRKEWLQTVNITEPVPRKNCYCCEDHFNLKEDAENWLKFKLLFCKTLRLKSDVVPHRYIKTPPKEKLPPQFTDSTSETNKKGNVKVLLIQPLSQPCPVAQLETSTSRSIDTMCTNLSEELSQSIIKPNESSTALRENRVQVVLKPKFRSVAVNVKVRVEDRATSPLFRVAVKPKSSPPKKSRHFTSVSSAKKRRSTCSSSSRKRKRKAEVTSRKRLL